MRTHEELGMTFAEYGALLGTRELLRSSLMGHGPDGFPSAREHTFNMNVCCITFACGSVSCIGGTMALIMGVCVRDIRDYVCSHEVLRSLFFPSGFNFNLVTAEQAVAAIDNFLETGAPRWSEVLGDSAAEPSVKF